MEKRDEWTVEDRWSWKQVFDYEREMYELREWWCRPRQVTKQIELPLDEPEQPRDIKPF